MPMRILAQPVSIAIRLPYEAVRTAENPAQALLLFLQTTYDAAATLAAWDRAALERKITQA